MPSQEPAEPAGDLGQLAAGHARQLASVARAHLVNLVERSGLLPGIEEQAFIDIDSLLRPVYGHTKQGASFGCRPRRERDPVALLDGAMIANACEERPAVIFLVGRPRVAVTTQGDDLGEVAVAQEPLAHE